jgi:hypothetical protein
MLRRAAATGKDFAAIGREAVGYGPARAPEILSKMVGARLHHQLGPFDFFLSDLFNRPRDTWHDYLREQPHTDRMLRALHPPRDEAITRDKVTAAERVVAGGLPIVPTLAVVGRDPARPGATLFRLLNSVESVVEAQARWPDEVFTKPVSGSFGQGVMALRRSGDGIWLDGDAPLDAPAVAARLLAYPNPAGILVQPRLFNDPAMATISSGRGLCATRFITALTTDGPEIVAVIHKMLGRDAIADNFSGGMTGNLICGVAPAGGGGGVELGRPPAQRFLLTRYDRHPSTGQPLRGFQLPHWAAARRVALDAAGLFPELPLLGHDVVITDRGPLFLETNTHWRISLPQLAVGGLRPVLRGIIPRLAAPEEKRRAALAAIG